VRIAVCTVENLHKYVQFIHTPIPNCPFKIRSPPITINTDHSELSVPEEKQTWPATCCNELASHRQTANESRDYCARTLRDGQYQKIFQHALLRILTLQLLW